ncbi:MAG: serine hydrolase [Longimicrobiales bacterium]
MASDLSASLDACAAQAAEEPGVPGLALAVVKDGALAFAEGYGVADLATGAPVDVNTLFALSSCTKAFTAAALGVLVDEGKVSWDDPVTKHLPWFRLRDAWLTRELTVRDILTHRSGLGATDFLWRSSGATTRGILEKLALVDSAYSLRSGFAYQNVMFSAAGEVIAAVSGTPWADFVRARLLGPLGMERTATSLVETAGRPNVASPHVQVDGRAVVLAPMSMDAVGPSCGMWSSVADVSKWLRFLLAGGVAEDGARLLQEETVAELFLPQAFVGRDELTQVRAIVGPQWTTFGLGFFQHDYLGRKVDSMSVGTDGFDGTVALVLSEGIGVVALANGDRAPCNALGYQILDTFLGGPGRDWLAEWCALDAEEEAVRKRRLPARIPGTSPSLPLAGYVGRYADPLYGELTIGDGPEGLRIDYGPGQGGALGHFHYDTFRVAWDARWRSPGLLTFILAADGKVGLCVLDDPDGGGHFQREA